MNHKLFIYILAATLLMALFCLSSCSPKPSFESIDAARFAQEITKEQVQLVDVRTPEEYAQGHIPSAINMNVNDATFDDMITTLDKDKTVALYCRSGRRSKLAAEKIANAGYKVLELNEGILSWKGEIEK